MSFVGEWKSDKCPAIANTFLFNWPDAISHSVSAEKRFTGECMKKLLTSLLLIASITFGMTGCNKTKTLATIRQADELSAKMLIYARNIAKANNDSFTAGNISSTVHLTTNEAVDTFLKGIDAYNQAVAAAKQAIANGADPPSQLQILEDVFGSQVVGAGLALARLAVNVPPALADKIGGWAEAIQLALVAFEGLFAQLRTEVVNANV